MREEGAPCTCVAHRWCTALPPEAAAALRRRKPLLVRGADPAGGRLDPGRPHRHAAGSRCSSAALIRQGILAAPARGGLSV